MLRIVHTEILGPVALPLATFETLCWDAGCWDHGRDGDAPGTAELVPRGPSLSSRDVRGGRSAVEHDCGAARLECRLAEELRRAHGGVRAAHASGMREGGRRTSVAIEVTEPKAVVASFRQATAMAVRRSSGAPSGTRETPPCASDR